MSIRSIIIQNIEAGITAKFVAQTLFRQGYAETKAITLIPYLKNGVVYKTAYVDIANWADSEVAYNFIKRLNNDALEARICYSDDDWWVVTTNTHNQGNINLYSYSTQFPSGYFQTITSPKTSLTA